MRRSDPFPPLGSYVTQPRTTAGASPEAMVAPVFLAPLIAEATLRQFSLEPLFRGLDIEAADFEVPGAMISHREAIGVVRRALALLAIAERGLELGQRAMITERGVLALGLLSAPTLGDAVGLSLRHPRSAGYLLQVRGDVRGDTHVLTAESYLGEQDVRDFLVDLTFSATVSLRRQVRASRDNPSAIEFMRKAPAHAAAYEAFFGCPVHFGRHRNVLLTPTRTLAMPLPWANAQAYRLSSQLLERESDSQDRMPVVVRTVERALSRGLPGAAALSDVAGSLNLSERTLRRQLAEVGLSYRALQDDSRKTRALDLMTGPGSIGEIAAETGFSDTRSFARAFKRWTGESPARFRDRLASPGQAPPIDGD
jgi:AraC-like DNA-binding protein